MTLPPDRPVAPPTEYENEPPPPTEYEAPAPGTAAGGVPLTEEEAGAERPAAPARPRGDTGQLPLSLRDRFRLRAVLRRPELPHQAAVFRVEDAHGTHILKWYDSEHAPEPAVWGPLLERRRPHLTHYTEADRTGADGHPYDLAPSYGETDLATRLRDRPGPVEPALLASVVRQLHAALTNLHELGIVHRDLSPANVVLGSLDPADPELVLVDFGVSAHAPEERYSRAERWAGTALYMSPQASLRNQLIHPPGDWWSLGMIVAEMAGGRHPVPYTDNDFVREEISSRAPDLSLVTDHRLLLLCTGLLTRDPDHRWGSEEVAQWLAGGSPQVAPWEAGSAPGASDPAGSPGVDPYPFLGEEYTRPGQLARAFGENWRQARTTLGGRRGREDFVRWLRQFEGSPGRDPAELNALVGLLANEVRPATLVRLISWLGPTLDASYRGVPLDRAGLRDLLREAGRGDDFARSVVADLGAHTILPLLEHRPGGEGLQAVHQRWITALSRWEQTAEELIAETAWPRQSREEARAAARLDGARRAALLALAADPEASRARLARRAAERLDALPQPVAWYRRLVRDHDDLVRMHLAERLAFLAERESWEARARIEADRAVLRQQRDLDAAAIWLRRQDMAPTLGWAVGGAAALILPWILVIGVCDVLGWADQATVLTAWLLAVPGAAAVLALELWTAYRIGSPGYHPDRSLAGLVIDRALPFARFARQPGARFPVRGLVLLLLPFGLLFLTLAHAAWAWPAGTVAVLAWWTVRRLHRWHLHLVDLRSGARGDPGPARPRPRRRPRPRTRRAGDAGPGSGSGDGPGTGNGPGNAPGTGNGPGNAAGSAPGRGDGPADGPGERQDRPPGPVPGQRRDPGGGGPPPGQRPGDGSTDHGGEFV
ncbi:protein kinase [Streptomyces sp. NPDC020141]|uniref:protein kinase domain-containing protein n=1 Tax=Streptomyces sp. NPDC020141 TaxID=3365065 RepID=UPI0037B93CF7